MMSHCLFFSLQFYPMSGPFEGNTRVEINGTDLGMTFGDIQNVRVSGVNCSVAGMERYYEPGQRYIYIYFLKI